MTPGEYRRPHQIFLHDSLGSVCPGASRVEHAAPEEFPGLLKALHRSLKPGGYFHIAMKLGADAGRDRLGRFYAYYSRTELHRQLTEAGFIIEKTDTGELHGLAGDLEPWIAVLAHAAESGE